MKAIICECLARRSWSGRLLIPHTIIGTKENIIEKVNSYIEKKLNFLSDKDLTQYIPVKTFNVNIYNAKGKKINGWQYSPTYR